MDTDEIAAKAKKLEEWLKASIEYVDKKTRENKSRATTVRMATLSLSGLATLFLGLKLGGGFQEIAVSVAFALTAIVTFLNALEPFFNFRALWVEHESAEAKFKKLYDDFRFYREGKKPEAMESAAIEQFYARYAEAWAELNEAWSRERKAGDIALKKKPPS